MDSTAASWGSGAEGGAGVTWRVIKADALEGLRSLPDESVQCCVTSPPYFGLRDYGVEGQLGLEATPAEYVERLVKVFREVRRALRADGTLWLNLGDSYAGSWGAQSRGDDYPGNLEGGSMLSARQIAEHPRLGSCTGSLKRTPGLKPKDLIGIPWRVAFALQDDGWYLRMDVVWSKPNPMPESVRDRPTKSHEYLFLLTKGERYFWDREAVREGDAGTDHPRNVLHQPEPSGGLTAPHRGIRRPEGRNGAGRNIRSVWTIATTPFKDWAESVRQVPVSLDEADDDTMRIPSVDCPVHEYSGRPDPIRVGDERAAEKSSRTPGSSDRHAQVPASGSAPTAPNLDAGSLGESSDSPHQTRAHSATSRSTQSRKTVPAHETSQPYTLSYGTPRHTGGTSAPRESCAPHRDTHESSTSSDDSGDNPSPETPDRTPGKPLGHHISSACSCSYEKTVTESVSHFAVFPPELPRRCILAGTSERGCCPECGAPWERIVKSGQGDAYRKGERNRGGRTDGWTTMGGGQKEWSEYLSPKTVGWRPTCLCYGPLYGSDFPRARRARKRRQRDLSGDWRRRVHRRPGRSEWPTVSVTVLDPFCGSGTTGMVARQLGRSFIGIELSPEYAAMAERRIGEACVETVLERGGKLAAISGPLFDEVLP